MALCGVVRRGDKFAFVGFGAWLVLGIGDGMWMWMWCMIGKLKE